VLKLWEVVRFETACRLRRPATWACFAAVAGLTVLLARDVLLGTARASANVHADAPILVAQVTVLVGALALVVLAALFGDAAARDARWRLDPLVRVAPVDPRVLALGRFLAAAGLAAALLAVVPAALAALHLTAAEPELYGRFRAATYLAPYLVFALPNLLAAGALAFAAAWRTGSTLAAYGAAALLFVGGVLVEEALAETLGQGALAAVLDPLGFTVLSELFAYWTPFERDTRPLVLAGPLLWNRLLWLGIGAAAMADVLARRRPAVDERAPRGGWWRRRRGRTSPADGGAEAATAPIVVPRAPRAVGGRGRVGQVLAFARLAFATVVANRWSLLVVAAAVAHVFAAGWNPAVVFDTPSLPASSVVVPEVLGGGALLASLLIGLWVGQLVWMEREARADELTDAAPWPPWVAAAGKLLALAGGLVAWQAVVGASVVLLQALQGHRAFDLGLAATMLFGLGLPDLLLVVVLALAVHVAVGHKALGHVVFLAALVVSRNLLEGDFGFEHHLLGYSSTPGWRHSELSGFEPFLAPHLWFLAYWSAWALLLAGAAALLWPRGREGGWRGRLAAARRRWTRLAAAWAGAAAALVAVLGGFLFANTNLLHEYRTGDDRRALLAGYERRWSRDAEFAQPEIVRTELRVELHPRRRRAELGGTHRLVNRTAEAIPAVHLLLHPDLAVRALSFDRPARLAVDDAVHGVRVYALDEPLPPGGELALRFELAFAPRGFSNDGAPAEVLENGTFFERRWLPIVGYQPELELADAAARRELGLPPRRRLPPIDDPVGRRFGSELRDADWIELETTIGTDPDQLAVAPGSLVRTWREGGRRWFHYRTEAPIKNNYPILSGRYAVRRSRWRDVEVEIYHHPGHTANLERIERGLHAGLEHHARTLGPYPHRQLRLVEFPRHRGNYAWSFPGTIAYSEGVGFLARGGEEVDFPFLVAVHEVAHQWWGHQVKPARVAGGPVLGETLAHDGALRVLGETHGPVAVRRALDVLRHGYLAGRQRHRGEEVPLLLSNDQRYLHYDKGAVAMAALRAYVGNGAVDRALGRFFAAHRFGSAPFPTTRQLYAELAAATPPEHRGLLRDLFAEITLWELATTGVRVEEAAAGFRVTLDVTAAKRRGDGAGREREVAMDDLVEIGLFAGEAAPGDPGEPLYLARHRLTGGRQSISVTVPRPPARAGVDPYRWLIDRDTADNVREVAAREAPAGAATKIGP
jgi:ABC-2 type transport system permease protein